MGHSSIFSNLTLGSSSENPKISICPWEIFFEFWSAIFIDSGYDDNNEDLVSPKTSNEPDFINASIILLFIFFEPHLFKRLSKLLKFPFLLLSSIIISIIELPTPFIAPRP